MARLSEEQKERILYLISQGESGRAIAREVGCSETAVRKMRIANPECLQKFARKKEENIASVLLHMEEQKGQVCSILDAMLAELSDRDRMKEATLPQLATALGILIDKYTRTESPAVTDGKENNLMEALAGVEVSTDEIPELQSAAEDVGAVVEDAGNTDG